MSVKRRSLLKAVFLGSALAFPAFRIEVARNPSLKSMVLKGLASRPIGVNIERMVIFEVGQSNLTSSRDWGEP